MTAEALPALPWSRLSALIAARTGLHFPPERSADLRRGLLSAAREFELSESQFADWLLSAPLSRRQLHVIAGHLTVGETYFFRERRIFEALAAHVLPELLARRRAERSLRIWSAACCTGEEPYSLSILLQQCVPNLASWRATVLATDINERFLQKAVAGIYGEWSFRDVPEGFRERYFTRASDDRWAVLPQLRQRVRFAPLNLAEDHFPNLATDTQAMDLIFCRNVLMYFTREHAARVVEKLRHSLRDDGWLVLSSSESTHALSSSSGFRPVNFPGATLYRKSTGQPDATPAEPAVPRTVESPYPQSGHQQADKLMSSFVAEAAPPPQFSLLARALANQGKLAAALSCCDSWIAAEPLDAGARYLRAVILEETGQTDAAHRSLRQALYLHPDFVLAHFALGNLARTARQMEAAHRHFENTLALLNKLPAEQALPESDGLTAGRLKEIIESLFVLENAP